MVTEPIIPTYIQPAIQTALSIAALISSALLFYFGRTRSRKSEEIKIARELGERIEEKIRRLDESRIPRITSDNQFREVVRPVLELYEELRYFSYLVQIHEISNENTLRYYIPRLDSWFRKAATRLSSIQIYTTKEDPFLRLKVDDYLGFLDDVRRSIKPWLDKYPFDVTKVPH